MKAIQYEQFGGEAKLKEIDQPKPDTKQLLIRVRAASINPVDLELKRGAMKFASGTAMPKGFGLDFSGEVAETGSAVQHWKIGDEVMGWCPPRHSGSFAEFLVADPDWLIAKPSTLHAEEAAGLPMVGATVLKALFEQAEIQKGQRIFLNGASGGVGHIAAQIANKIGVQVEATCSAKHIDFVKDLGVEKVYDYTKGEFPQADKQFDLFFDVAPASSFAEAKKYLRPRGHYITTRPGFSQGLAMLTNKLLGGRQNHFLMAQAKQAQLRNLKEIFEGGKYQVHIGRRTPFSEAEKAIKLVEEGPSVPGKEIVYMKS